MDEPRINFTDYPLWKRMAAIPLMFVVGAGIGCIFIAFGAMIPILIVMSAIFRPSSISWKK